MNEYILKLQLHQQLTILKSKITLYERIFDGIQFMMTWACVKQGIIDEMWSEKDYLAYWGVNYDYENNVDIWSNYVRCYIMILIMNEKSCEFTSNE